MKDPQQATVTANIKRVETFNRPTYQDENMEIISMV